MSTAPDQKQEALGRFMRSEHGPDYVRDAMSDELIREMADLYICGDLAAIGDVFQRHMLADRDIPKAIQARHEAAERQFQLQLSNEAHEAAPLWYRDWASNHDVETGIRRYGEI